jgi:hypothetical protein
MNRLPWLLLLLPLIGCGGGKASEQRRNAARVRQMLQCCGQQRPRPVEQIE